MWAESNEWAADKLHAKVLIYSFLKHVKRTSLCHFIYLNLLVNDNELRYMCCVLSFFRLLNAYVLQCLCLDMLCCVFLPSVVGYCFCLPVAQSGLVIRDRAGCVGCQRLARLPAGQVGMDPYPHGADFETSPHNSVVLNGDRPLQTSQLKKCCASWCSSFTHPKTLVLYGASPLQTSQLKSASWCSSFTNFTTPKCSKVLASYKLHNSNVLHGARPLHTSQMKAYLWIPQSLFNKHNAWLRHGA